jgi:hypothetical protein
MAVKLTALLSRKNKELEARVIEALRHEPVAAVGGRANPRELTFQLRSNKDAINARMRLYNAMKKLGEDVTVKIEGIAYR